MTDNKDIAEELFCLRFELNTLSSVLIKHEAERWVSGFMYEQIEKDHIDRYVLAFNYVAGKKVLDIACGIGKGSYMMATEGKASEVTGGDLSSDAVRYARHRNPNGNVQYKVQDALKLEWENEFDVVVSFETIEHVPDVDLFLKKIKQALKGDGLFLVSTPISSSDLDTRPDNPYHVQEWGFESFQRKLSHFFAVEEVYLQLYDPVPVQKREGFLDKIRRRLVGASPAAHSPKTGSRIEKYSNQYPVNEIGTIRKGYQLVVCKKR